MEHLFVYGTLLKDIQSDTFQSVKSFLKFESEGYLKGKLFDLGEYPAVVDDNKTSGKVKGEVYTINNADKVFNILDEYEGIHDPEPEYSRRKKIVAVSKNKNIKSWVYLYAKPMERHIKQIESGDYLAFIKDKNIK